MTSIEVKENAKESTVSVYTADWVIKPDPETILKNDRNFLLEF